MREIMFWLAMIGHATLIGIMATGMLRMTIRNYTAARTYALKHDLQPPSTPVWGLVIGGFFCAGACTIGLLALWGLVQDLYHLQPTSTP